MRKVDCGTGAWKEGVSTPGWTAVRRTEEATTVQSLLIDLLGFFLGLRRFLLH